ncbi:transthyretin-like family domain-containing protein [Ditylenchus destructor]|uniref:Transthyretin-like family domain-containing protein n=1 Tax=Ditylenchus destructor TaxID=166010 RepID=A0AAD4R080_9BILA|nr:transthyretin-like family domain-containing protein [Ditylenchus destructor]
MTSPSATIFLILSVFVINSTALFPQEQSINVTGVIFCASPTEPPVPVKIGDQWLTPPKGIPPLPSVLPFVGAKIRLMESEIFLDDVLDRTESGMYGAFSVTGHDKESSYIDPYLVVQYRNCDHFSTPEGCTYARLIKLNQNAPETVYRNLLIVVGGANHYDQIKC